MTLRVAQADPRDTPALMKLHLDVLAEERWFVTTRREYGYDPFSLLEHIKRLLSAEHSNIWVAHLGDELVGFATATGSSLQRLSHVARFEVMVAEPARGNGVGRALTEAALAWARHSDRIHKVSLAVFDDNDRAIALYRSLGFVEEGRRRGEYQEADGTLRGDVLMAISV